MGKLLSGVDYGKYALYERAVQSPDVHIQWVNEFFKDLNNGVDAYDLREDFSGTFLISCEWVKDHKDNTAIAVDLDPEPLSYGRKHHLARLSPEERKRITIKKADVLTVTSPKVDAIAACNFSFYIFKDRDFLVRYFRQAFRSLRKGGILVLEMAGGPGMIAKEKEHRRITKRGKHWFTYVWDQKSFNPVNRNGMYGIHFKLPNGKIMKDAFVYDWRIWTIPEVYDALREAGFQGQYTYWEKKDKHGDDTGEYVRLENAENDHTWISYIVGHKTK